MRAYQPILFCPLSSVKRAREHDKHMRPRACARHSDACPRTDGRTILRAAFVLVAGNWRVFIRLMDMKRKGEGNGGGGGLKSKKAIGFNNKFCTMVQQVILQDAISLVL